MIVVMCECEGTCVYYIMLISHSPQDTALEFDCKSSTSLSSQKIDWVPANMHHNMHNNNIILRPTEKVYVNLPVVE